GRSLLFLRQQSPHGRAIFVADADGSNEREVNPGPAFDPAWSPDGAQIAYSDGSDIFVENLDGSDRRRLTNDGNYNDVPVWSPDDKWIAFVHYPPRETMDGSRIPLVRPDGSERVGLAAGNGADGPDWSPDGTKIVYADTGRAGSKDIYVVSAKDG